MPLPLDEVLVVEDEADSMELIQGVLHYHGIASRGVNTANEALAAIQTQTPGLIIIDLSLPDFDGWTLLQRLQEIPSLCSVPKIAITAYHDLALAQIALKAGFSGYFFKPIDASSFVQSLLSIWCSSSK
jgi:CheY-like chemotaxis protein